MCTGQVYKGEWENNQMHGQGVMTWQNPQVCYVGSWANGKRSGLGRITFADDDEAERVFYDGKLHPDHHAVSWLTSMLT